MYADLLATVAAYWHEHVVVHAVPIGSAALLIGAAEFGDKSQLMCMSLSARYRPWPVLWGAVFAFCLLNGVGVAFGAVVTGWIPQQWLAVSVGVLFLLFGIQNWRAPAEHDDDAKARVSKPRFGAFMTTLLMVTAAELGDKTQLSVAGLAVSMPWLAVWLGATTALFFTTAVGVWAGHTWLSRLPMRRVHQVSGLMFVAFGMFALSQAVPRDWLAGIAIGVERVGLKLWAKLSECL